MDLPNGETVGIIDVPGHRDFIANMLAGVGGIDAALLVIAADEGVMPQTREHLSILDLLEIQHCVVALTKVDLVDESGWMEMVRNDVAALLKATRFDGAQIVGVSAVTGFGLDELLGALGEALAVSAPRPDFGRPRLPIDRAFSIAGFGTVVTGTLRDGALEVGDEVVVLPSGKMGRVRGLQTHKTKVNRAIAGSRVAANLTSIEVSSVERGDVACLEDHYAATRMMDASLRLLPDAASPIRHNQNVKIFLGPAQRMARVRLLGVDKLEPGEDGWMQIVLDHAVVAARGDRFIIRRPSPGATLGGGRIADAHPARRYRRKDANVITRLERLLRGSPAEVIMEVLSASGPMRMTDIVDRSGLDEDDVYETVKGLVAKGEMIALGEGELELTSDRWVIDDTGHNKWIERLGTELNEYHGKFPLREGMPREELKSRAKLDTKPFNLIIEAAIKRGLLIEKGYKIRTIEHEPKLAQHEAQAVDDLKKRFRSSEYAPPSVKDVLESVGDELMAYLLNDGWLVRVSRDVVFEGEIYRQMVDKIREELITRETLKVAQVRDLFKTSRKYALALMEHLDEIGVTIRDGDIRRLA